MNEGKAIHKNDVVKEAQETKMIRDEDEDEDEEENYLRL